MYEHGPKCLEGPRRGTPGWWQELGKLDAAAPARTRQRSRKRARQTAERGSRIRTELVERVRREIAAGTYDTPEKWEAALDRLLDRLCPE
jgi:negative regulator of flagellin synthesis FlgM